MSNISLLDNPIRVSTPFIKVTIGDYVFGLFSHTVKEGKDTTGVYHIHSFQYPNYIQSLKVTKINGQVNQYELLIKYPITESNDPNFFEKVFSSVSKSRKIVFSYGDLSAPEFLYKDEEALILDTPASLDMNSAVITYTVTAVSSCQLSLAGANNFTTAEFTGMKQPSTLIKKILRNNTKYGLQDVFTGMRNMDLIESLGLISSDDKIVNLEGQVNISTLDYLRYLVNNMRNQDDESRYTLVVVDDTSGTLNGPYFKVVNAVHSGDSLDTYVLDIGYPSPTVVTNFNTNNNQSYSILYNYSKKLNTNEYVSRIDDKGEIQQIYSPNITSNNNEQITHSNDLTWWKNVTEYPISAVITIKGVLRPAILMSKVRLNVLFYGKAYIASGEYIINKQVDNIDSSGCWTTLNLVRIGGDDRNFSNIV